VLLVTHASSFLFCFGQYLSGILLVDGCCPPLAHFQVAPKETVVLFFPPTWFLFPYPSPSQFISDILRFPPVNDVVCFHLHVFFSQYPSSPSCRFLSNPSLVHQLLSLWPDGSCLFSRVYVFDVLGSLRILFGAVGFTSLTIRRCPFTVISLVSPDTWFFPLFSRFFSSLSITSILFALSWTPPRFCSLILC